MILKLKWWLWDCGKGELPNPTESEKWRLVMAVCAGPIATHIVWLIAWAVFYAR